MAKLGIRSLSICILLFYSLAFGTCNQYQPNTKEEYLQRFELFIVTLVSECTTLSETRLKAANLEYKILSLEWYKKFQYELSFFEKAKIVQLKVQYYSCYGIRKFQLHLNDSSNMEVSQLNSQAWPYSFFNLNSKLTRNE